MSKKSYIIPSKTNNKNMERYLHRRLSEIGEGGDGSGGKYYGHFSTPEELPEGDTPGYAYVGENPSSIYDFVDGEWRDSGQTVDQSPIGNDEDIDQDEDGKLQFANRVYNAQQPNGMGYKILRKNASFASQVTEANTVYEIRYNYDLGNTLITIPAGCTLKFVGGCLSNGTIKFDMTKIVSENKCFATDVNFDTDGYITNDEVRISWFVAKTDVMLKEVGTFYDCHNEIRKASLLAGRMNGGFAFRRGGVLNLEHIQLAVTSPIVFDTEYDSNLIKNGNIAFFSTEDGQSIFHYNNNGITYCPIENCVFMYRGTVSTMAESVAARKTYHEHINAIRFESAAPTCFSYWRDIRAEQLTGYVFVNQVYIQECMFVNVTSFGCNGMISYDVDHYYNGAAGSSNVVTMENCNLNGGSSIANYLSKCTVEYLWDFVNFLKLNIKNAVSQGTGISGQKVLRLGKSDAYPISQKIVLDSFGCEYGQNTVDERMFVGCNVDIHMSGTNVLGFVTLGNGENVNIFNNTLSIDGYSSTFIDRSEIADGTTQVIIYYETSTYSVDFVLSQKFLSWMDKGIIRTINTRKATMPNSTLNGSAYIKTSEYCDMKEQYVFSLYRMFSLSNINGYVSSFSGIPTVIIENPGTGTFALRNFLTTFSDASGIFVELVYRCAPMENVTAENKSSFICKIFGKSLCSFDEGTQAGAYTNWKRFAYLRKLPINTIDIKKCKIEIALFVISNSFVIRQYKNFSYDGVNETITARQFNAEFMPIVQLYESNIPSDFLCSHILMDNVMIKTGNQAFIKQDGNLVSLKEMSGTTANRPTFVAPGSHYFDTTLGKPVYAKSVTSAGVVTWVDATGATV